jgi:hypothetical protein
MNIETVDIFWWNINDHYHFDPSKSGERWPKSAADYLEKCNRVANAFDAFFRENNHPKIIALCEITKQAALDLQRNILRNYDLISLDVAPDKPSLQISLFIARQKGVSITEHPPIVVDDVPRGTRPMAVLDIEKNKASVRLVACHWPARISDESERYRERSANYLAKYSYDYIDGTPKGHTRSLIIIGDLNDEPFDRSLNYLNTHRHRSKAASKHWADDDVRRIHLYNCTWRLLGEKMPHTSTASPHKNVAGSYYWSHKKSWHNLDQIIISNGLLSKDPPHIDESSTFIVNTPEFIPEEYPHKFQKESNSYIGLSDHLPIYTKIIF